MNTLEELRRNGRRLPWILTFALAMTGGGEAQEGYFTAVREVELGDPFQHNKLREDPRLTPDGKTLCLTGWTDAGRYDIYVAHRFDDAFPFVRNAAEINTSAHERPGCFSSDGTEFYFMSGRRGSSLGSAPPVASTLSSPTADAEPAPKAAPAAINPL